LVEKLRSRDLSALDYLYDHYSPALYGIILRIVLKRSIAEEVLQDVFLKIWERFDGYDQTKGRLFTWMLNIARNHAIDKTRSKEISTANRTTGLEKFVSNTDQPFLEQNVDDIGVIEILKNLPDEQRFVVDYLYFRGYTHSEVSEEFNIPLGTVKTRLRLAMQHLRNLLGVN
jgi:RNA polymerase sigma factor (sigma-70 family)